MMAKHPKASERLLDKVRPLKGDSVGISIAHIAKMSLTADVIADLLECLRSEDPSELSWGLWFAQGVLHSNPPQELLHLLLRNLSAWISCPLEAVRERAFPLLIQLRRNLPDYRSIMLQCLKDPSPEIRAGALAAYQTFLTEKDINFLLDFEHDQYMSETAMNSPLIYPIRNQALAVIEQLCGRTFRKNESVKALPEGHTVYWWEWKPFLEWWSRRRSS